MFKYMIRVCMSRVNISRSHLLSDGFRLGKVFSFQFAKLFICLNRFKKNDECIFKWKEQVAGTLHCDLNHSSPNIKRHN